MRAYIALLWLVALGAITACSADFGANRSTRCDETTACPLSETCYRGFCVQGRDVDTQLDGSLSPITEVEAGFTPGLPSAGDGGPAAAGDAQLLGAPLAPASRDGGSPVMSPPDAGPSSVPSSDDASAPVQPSPSTPTTPPTVDPTPVAPAPTTPAPTTPEPTPPAPAPPPAPTTPEPTPPAPPVTPEPTPVIDAGAPEASVPTDPGQSSPLLLCLAVCITRSQLCLVCLGGAINDDPSVCDERQVRGDRELRELCDWLCTSPECRGSR